MAVEINGELHLNAEETRCFLNEMIHPDREALARRDAFMSNLDMSKITFGEDCVSMDCSDLHLDDLFLPKKSASSIYDGVAIAKTNLHYEPTEPFQCTATVAIRLRKESNNSLSCDENWISAVA